MICAHAACEYLKKLTLITAYMGGTIMVLGSPQQRNLEHGTLYENAFSRARDIIIEVSGIGRRTRNHPRHRTSFTCRNQLSQFCQEARRFIAAVNHPPAVCI